MKSTISFRNQYVNPPSNVYIENGNGFRLSVWTSVTCSIGLDARLLQYDNGNYRILYTHYDLIPSAAQITGRSRINLLIPLAEGFLLSARVNVTSGTVFRGQVWSTLDIVQDISATNLTVIQSLLGEYISSTTGIAWPGTPISQSLNGVGYYQSYVTPISAVVPTTVIQVPANTRWKFISATASGTAGAGGCHLLFESRIFGGANDSRAVITPLIPAGTFAVYFSSKYPNVAAQNVYTISPDGINTELIVPVPESVLDPTGAITVYYDVAGLVAGGTFSISVEEHLDI